MANTLTDADVQRLADHLIGSYSELDRALYDLDLPLTSEALCDDTKRRLDALCFLCELCCQWRPTHERIAVTSKWHDERLLCAECNGEAK